MSKSLKRLTIAELNSCLLCSLCGGYYVDAISITECLHTFCKTCIVQYFESSKFCPVCDVLVHKTDPFLGIRPDKKLQSVVYKLVPGLHTNEMLRRQEFYSKVPTENGVPSSLEDGGTHSETQFLLNGDTISLVLEPLHTSAQNDIASHRRYFSCPAEVSILHLKKLLRAKFDLGFEVPIVFSSCKDEKLTEDLTLLEVAYMKSWNKASPLVIYYEIFFCKKFKCEPDLMERPITIDEDVSREREELASKDLNSNLKDSSGQNSIKCEDDDEVIFDGKDLVKESLISATISNESILTSESDMPNQSLTPNISPILPCDQISSSTFQSQNFISLETPLLQIPVIDVAESSNFNCLYGMNIIPSPAIDLQNLIMGNVIQSPNSLGASVWPLNMTLSPNLLCSTGNVGNFSANLFTNKSIEHHSAAYVVQPFSEDLSAFSFNNTLVSKENTLVLSSVNFNSTVLKTNSTRICQTEIRCNSSTSKRRSKNLTSSSKNSRLKTKMKHPKIEQTKVRKKKKKKNKRKDSEREGEVQLMISESGEVRVNGRSEFERSITNLVNPIQAEADDLLKEVESGSLTMVSSISEDSKEEDSDYSDGAEKLDKIKKEISSILNILANDANPAGSIVTVDESFCSDEKTEEVVHSPQCSNDNVQSISHFENVVEMAKDENENTKVVLFGSTNELNKEGHKKLTSKNEEVSNFNTDSCKAKLLNVSSDSHKVPTLKTPNTSVSHASHAVLNEPSTSPKEIRKQIQPASKYKTLKLSLSPKSWNPTISKERMRSVLSSPSPRKFFKTRNSTNVDNYNQSSSKVLVAESLPVTSTKSKHVIESAELTSEDSPSKEKIDDLTVSDNFSLLGSKKESTKFAAAENVKEESLSGKSELKCKKVLNIDSCIAHKANSRSDVIKNVCPTTSTTSSINTREPQEKDTYGRNVVPMFSKSSSKSKERDNVGQNETSSLNSLKNPSGTKTTPNRLSSKNSTSSYESMEPSLVLKGICASLKNSYSSEEPPTSNVHSTSCTSLSLSKASTAKQCTSVLANLSSLNYSQQTPKNADGREKLNKKNISLTGDKCSLEMKDGCFHAEQIKVSPISDTLAMAESEKKQEVITSQTNVSVDLPIIYNHGCSIGKINCSNSSTSVITSSTWTTCNSITNSTNLTFHSDNEALSLNPILPSTSTDSEVASNATESSSNSRYKDISKMYIKISGSETVVPHSNEYLSKEKDTVDQDACFYTATSCISSNKSEIGDCADKNSDSQVSGFSETSFFDSLEGVCPTEKENNVPSSISGRSDSLCLTNESKESAIKANEHVESAEVLSELCKKGNSVDSPMNNCQNDIASVSSSSESFVAAIVDVSNPNLSSPSNSISSNCAVFPENRLNTTRLSSGLSTSSAHASQSKASEPKVVNNISPAASSEKASKMLRTDKELSCDNTSIQGSINHKEKCSPNLNSSMQSTEKRNCKETFQSSTSDKLAANINNSSNDRTCFFGPSTSEAVISSSPYTNYKNSKTTQGSSNSKVTSSDNSAVDPQSNLVSYMNSIATFQDTSKLMQSLFSLPPLPSLDSDQLKTNYKCSDEDLDLFLRSFASSISVPSTCESSSIIRYPDEHNTTKSCSQIIGSELTTKVDTHSNPHQSSNAKLNQNCSQLKSSESSVNVSSVDCIKNAISSTIPLTNSLQNACSTHVTYSNSTRQQCIPLTTSVSPSNSIAASTQAFNSPYDHHKQVAKFSNVKEQSASIHQRGVIATTASLCSKKKDAENKTTLSENSTANLSSIAHSSCSAVRPDSTSANTTTISPAHQQPAISKKSQKSGSSYNDPYSNNYSQFSTFPFNSMLSNYYNGESCYSPSQFSSYKYPSQSSWEMNALSPFFFNNNSESYNNVSSTNYSKNSFNSNNSSAHQNFLRGSNQYGNKELSPSQQSYSSNFNSSNFVFPKQAHVSSGNAHYGSESETKKNHSSYYNHYDHNFSLGNQRLNPMHASFYYANYNNNYSNFISHSQNQSSSNLAQLVPTSGSHNAALTSSKYNSSQHLNLDQNSHGSSYFSSNFNSPAQSNNQSCSETSVSNAVVSTAVTSSNFSNNFPGAFCNFSLPYYSNCSLPYNSYPYLYQGSDMGFFSPAASFMPSFPRIPSRASLSSHGSSKQSITESFPLETSLFPMVPFVSPLQGHSQRASSCSSMNSSVPSSKLFTDCLSQSSSGRNDIRGSHKKKSSMASGPTKSKSRKATGSGGSSTGTISNPSKG